MELVFSSNAENKSIIIKQQGPSGKWRPGGVFLMCESIKQTYDRLNQLRMNY
ncbi:unnamed protein product, partial [marine sediment metagenome]